MMLDLQNLFSDSQNLAQVVGAYLSDYSIDTGTAGVIPMSQAMAVAALGGATADSARRDLGAATELEVLAQVDTTFTSGGAGTLKCELVMADDAALTTNLVVLRDSGAIALATLVAGYQFRIGASLPLGTTKRFVGLRWTVAGAAMTAGTCTAGIAKDRQSSGYLP